MIATLALIQQALRSRLGYMRDADIYLADDLTVLPADVMLPCIGIKDGPVSMSELAGGVMEYRLQVELMINVPVFRPQPQEVLMGGRGRKGVLEIERDMDEALDENRLGDSAIISAVKASPAQPSEPATDGQADIQRKRITYEYVKQTLRPSAARG